jgi:hypothetical protein
LVLPAHFRFVNRIEGVTADKEKLRKALCGDCLVISDAYAGIFAKVDSFVAQSQGNDAIDRVILRPYDADPGNYELLDKVGQGVGNLKSLRELSLHLDRFGEPDWEILARILPHIQNKIKLHMIRSNIEEGTLEMRAFARAI